MGEFALAEVFEVVATRVPLRECIVQGARRFTYAAVRARTRSLARQLIAHGLGAVRPRAELEGWQSGQDHVALYMYNRPEYLETMLACFQARLVPCNVNYRYTDSELIALLHGARTRALVFDDAFAPMVARVRHALPELRVLIQVTSADTTLLDGALPYESLCGLGEDGATPLPVCSPDDLYALFTGGTTGSPKGVLWRQADAYMAAFGGRDLAGVETLDLAEIGARADRGGGRILPWPPLMHGAAHWVALRAMFNGDSVILHEHVRRFDPEEVLATAEREQVGALLIVGDAFGRPLLDALVTGQPPPQMLRVIINGGAPLHVSTKRALLSALPGRTIVDAIGSSESGQQGAHLSVADTVQTGRFTAAVGTTVLSADLSRTLPPGDSELGWLAQTGRVPLGYLDDPEKTQRTFPLVNGGRHAVPGDRAYLLADGLIEVIGRDATTINSGGEKIFAEEVERVLKKHPAVYDVLVCSRPSPRWGEEVCAVVQLTAAATVSEDELMEHAGRELARFKLPRAFLFRDRLKRSPSGKPDYGWARSQFIRGSS